MHTIEANTIGECWIKCIKHIMNSGKYYYDEDVRIKEVLGLSVNILNPKIDDNIIKKFGDNSIVEHTLDKFSKGVSMPNRPFTYGACIYDKEGINQYEWLINRLETKKESKSATFSLLTSGDTNPNLPCLTTVDAKIRENKLELQFFFRSQNIFGRQYANLIALVKLQNDIAKRLKVNIGSLKGYVASAHIYDYDFEEAKLIIVGGNINIKDKYYTNGPKSIRK